MKKKILIGSIIAVTILLGVSFTSVVGYNKLDSGLKASPLFNIRSSRAIDEEDSTGLSCEYVGKDKLFMFTFPIRDNKVEIFHKLIEIIIRMNDSTYNIFINRIIENKKHNTRLSDIYIEDIIIALDYIREHSEELKKYYIEDIAPRTVLLEGCTPTLEYIPRCIFLTTIYLAVIWGVFYSIIFIISIIATAMSGDCETLWCPTALCLFTDFC